MMKSVFALTFAALMTCGLQAQVSGSLNNNAAKVSTTLEMGGNKLSVNYTALRFGDGSWQKIKDAEDRHEGFNKFAAKKPVGSVKTSCDLIVAGKTIAAGDYSMYFTIHKGAGWVLNLKPTEGELVRWRLHLSDTDKKSNCLKMSLEPTAKDGVCSIAISFGDKQVTVPVKIAPTKEEEVVEEEGKK